MKSLETSLVAWMSIALVASACSAITSLDDYTFDLGADADTDADTDADSDADSDTDSDTDTCSSEAYQGCYNGDVYWYDSCDQLEALAVDCPEHQVCEATSDTTAQCVCDDNWTGADCDECVGNWDVAEDCEECLPGWANMADDDCGTCVRRVDGAIDASGDGLSWGAAFQTIQAGIFSAWQATQAAGGPETCQVWVKTGEYSPTEGGGDDATFLMLENIEVYGGFSDEDDEWGERDWVANVTTMAGGGVFHVVTCAEDSVLDGFTVSGGDAWSMAGGADLNGAGIYCDDARFTVRHVVVSNHVAHGEGAGAWISGASADVEFEDCAFSSSNGHGGGGALAVVSGATVSLTGCSFTSNESAMSGAGEGGAIVIEGSTCTIDDCEFEDNSAIDEGGAVYSYASTLEIRDSSFDGNGLTAGGSYNYGGALSVEGGSLLVERTSFAGSECANYGRGGAISLRASATAVLENSTFFGGRLECTACDTYGGGLYVNNSSAQVMNCTFYDNSQSSNDEYGGAVYFNATASGSITNSIIWGNEPNGIEAASGAAYSFTYSDVQGGPWNPADHNLSVDPLFEGGTPYDLHIQTTSPCVDTGTSAGAPLEDMEGNVRPLGTGVDMGAYEVL